MGHILGHIFRPMCPKIIAAISTKNEGSGPLGHLGHITSESFTVTKTRGQQTAGYLWTKLSHVSHVSQQDCPGRIRLLTMSNTNKTPGPTARKILDELDRQGKTRYWLMKKANLDSPTVYGYLQGSLDCRISTVERMMGALSMGSHHVESPGVPQS